MTRKDRAALLEAKQLCKRAMVGMQAAGAEGNETPENLSRLSEIFENLVKVEAALSSLPGGD